MQIHNEKSEHANQVVKIKEGTSHPQNPNFAGSEFWVEDWWDRVTGKSWMEGVGNPACIVYAIRAGALKLPNDDEVLYGKIGVLGYLVHISEIERSM